MGAPGAGTERPEFAWKLRRAAPSSRKNTLHFAPGAALLQSADRYRATNGSCRSGALAAMGATGNALPTQHRPGSWPATAQARAIALALADCRPPRRSATLRPRPDQANAMSPAVHAFLDCCERILQGDAALIGQLRAEGFACAPASWTFSLPALHAFLATQLATVATRAPTATAPPTPVARRRSRD